MATVQKIVVGETEVSVLRIRDDDYICLTDMLKAKDGEFFFSNWLRNRNTIEFLGVWEKVNNPAFNCAEFDIIKSKAGLNSYRLSAKEWMQQTNAIGISGKCGMSLAAYNHSANRGQCYQLCRRKCRVTNTETGFEMDVDNQYIMSPKDICTIRVVDQLVEAGVSVFKLEGRGRAEAYVSTVTEVYREAVEACAAGTWSPEKVAAWEERLLRVFNRKFWHGGYYLGEEWDTWSGCSNSLALEQRHHESPGASYQDDGMFFQSMAFAERCMWVDDIVYMYRIDNPASSIQAGARKPFAEMEEFAFIRRRMEEAPEIWRQVQTYYTGLYIGAQRWIYPRIAEETRKEFLSRFREQLPELRSLGLNGLQPELMQGVETLERSVEDFMQSGAWLQNGEHPAPKSEHKELSILGLPVVSRSCCLGETTRRVLGIPVLSRRREPVFHDLGGGLQLPPGKRDVFRMLGIPFAQRNFPPCGQGLTLLHMFRRNGGRQTTLLSYPEVCA